MTKKWILCWEPKKFSSWSRLSCINHSVLFKFKFLSFDQNIFFFTGINDTDQIKPILKNSSDTANNVSSTTHFIDKCKSVLCMAKLKRSKSFFQSPITFENTTLHQRCLSSKANFKQPKHSLILNQKCPLTKIKNKIKYCQEKFSVKGS